MNPRPSRQRRPVRRGPRTPRTSRPRRAAGVPRLGRRARRSGPRAAATSPRTPRCRPTSTRPRTTEGGRPSGPRSADVAAGLRPRRLDRRRDPGQVPPGARPVHPRPGRRQVHRHHEAGGHPVHGRLRPCASRRTSTVAPAAAGDRPTGGRVAPRRPRSGAERFAPYIFVAPLLAVFAAFYLWPALVTVAQSFFRWGLLRPWSPVEPARWRFVGLEQLHHHPDRPQLLERGAQHGRLAGRLPPPGGRLLAAGVHAHLVHDPGRGTVFRTVFILPMTISLAAAGIIWSFIYNADPQIGVAQRGPAAGRHLVTRTGAGPAGAAPRLLAVQPGVLHIGWPDVRLTNSASSSRRSGRSPASASSPSPPASPPSRRAARGGKVDGAYPWQTIRHIPSRRCAGRWSCRRGQSSSSPCGPSTSSTS